MRLPRPLASLIALVYAAFARAVACCFFCRPARTRASRRFYRLLLPQRPAWYHLWCVFRQFQNFTTIHADRCRAALGLEPVFTSEGLERLERAAAAGQGAILVMSHVGNWEMAARLLARSLPDLKLLLYMGEKEKEGIEKSQKDGLRRQGITIAALGRHENDPFRAVLGLRLLQEGGVVSLTGDIVWQESQRFLEVDFLSGRARLPEAPFAFALVSGAPVFAFFTFRTGSNRYHFRLSEAIYVKAVSRAGRRQAMQEAARQYAALLEQAVREHPCQWYHFDDFCR
ncbi:MAG: lysophospholipid acyltransferase family protein [Desulfobulbaceae bacterium]|jgi:predicted LPLAT superfamily acyltransferase|nr:lysophospholipid acyltransferase family protein [Desulfobulbaceae bacterium]